MLHIIVAQTAFQESITNLALSFRTYSILFQESSIRRQECVLWHSGTSCCLGYPISQGLRTVLAPLLIQLPANAPGKQQILLQEYQMESWFLADQSFLSLFTQSLPLHPSFFPTSSLSVTLLLQILKFQLKELYTISDQHTKLLTYKR